MGLVKEFREFAVKGNVVDMAVGIIMGAAFGKVISSLVADVIMPPVGMALGGVDFKDLQVVLKAAVKDPKTGLINPDTLVAIHYGAFISTCIDFFIVASAMFLVIKVMNKVIRARERAAEPGPPGPPAPPEA